MTTSAEDQYNRHYEDPLAEVSYLVIQIERDNKHIILHTVATAINVQLDEQDHIPFVKPDNFALADTQDKLFIYGPGGSGKSRLMFELLASKLDHITRRLFIINPRQVPDTAPRRASLMQLVSKFNDSDIVLWDNFPDGLLKKDANSGKLALEAISSGSVQYLFIALKPKFLEKYSGIAQQIPDLYEYPVKYDVDKIKEIVRLYGTTITQFKDAYSTCLVYDISRIAKVLWQKEPFPLTVSNYYRELIEKINLGEPLPDPIATAQAMLYRTSYYDYQFEQLVNSEARRSDTEFLYTAKLCYELALDRRVDLVQDLQLQIFGTTRSEDISKHLSSWAYLSGNYVSMHDVPRDAIRLDEPTRAKIIDFLINRFTDVISDNEERFDLVGTFLGRNIKLVLENRANQNGILPNFIYQKMKSHRALEVAIGRGVGEVFHSLEQGTQQVILGSIEKDGEFARGLGESVGRSFENLDASVQSDILSSRISKSILFARGLGESLGDSFDKLSINLQDEIFRISLNEKNYNFQRGLGTGLGHKFRFLGVNMQKRLLDLSSRHIALAIGTGYGLAHDSTSSSISQEFQNNVMSLADGNSEMMRGLGIGLGQSYSFLHKDAQNKIMQWTEMNPRFEFGLAYQLSFLFTSLTEEYQNKILDKSEGNNEYAYGSGWGFGVTYTYLTKEVQQRLHEIARRNIRFATGLGAGIGNQLQYLDKENEVAFFSAIEKNEGFAMGAGFGIGRSFSFLKEDLRHKSWHLMHTNYSFAVGLGWGLGFAYSYLQQALRDKALDFICKEPGFACGLGWGLGFMFTYLSAEYQQQANDFALHNSQFAFGFGIGLGSLLNYLPQNLQQDVWRKAESNALFALGLGSELGYLFSYLPESMRNDALSKSESNYYFAKGMGWGLGHLLTSLPQESRQYLLRKMETSPELLRGLGCGFGRSLPYLSSEEQKTAAKMASSNLQFAAGLGEGVGRSFQHLDNPMKAWATQLSEENVAMARGLGLGMGHILNHLKPELRHQIWRRAEKDVQFAVGLGEGIGSVIGYLPTASRDEILAKLMKNRPLSHGFGSAVGSHEPFYQTGDSLPHMLAIYAKENNELLRGYGEGLGRMFSYWTQSTVDDFVKPNISHNMQFTIGLGTGIGKSSALEILQALSDSSANPGTSLYLNRPETLEKLLADDTFLYGLGLGISSRVDFMPEQFTGIIEQTLSNYQNFAFGLGYGVGRSFSYQNQKTQESSMKLAEISRDFAKGLGLGIGRSFRSLEPAIQLALLSFAEKNNEFAAGLGQGSGSIFPSLDETLTGAVISLVEKSEAFAAGFSRGLGDSFAYLEQSLQSKLASLTKMKDHDSSSGPHATQTDFSEFARRDEDFLIVPNWYGTSMDLVGKEQQEIDISKEAEILFSGKRASYCICYIDMMNSTRIAATLDDLQLGKYYSVFLNSMATIAKNFGATIIKNAGDCLIYYFPSTSDPADQSAFRDVVECGITMISAHRAINAKLLEQRLPPLNYRISADYGMVELAKSSSSQGEDLFGSTMNVCAKINSKAPANGMAMGHNLYQIIRPIVEKEFDFERVGEYAGFEADYPVYSIKSNQMRFILNPFKQTTDDIFATFGNDSAKFTQR